MALKEEGKRALLLSGRDERNRLKDDKTETKTRWHNTLQKMGVCAPHDDAKM